MNYLITFTILAAVAAWCARAERKRMEREAAREARQRARYDFDALDALIRATRERPHESYAWGAPGLERLATGADEPIPYELGDFALWQAELEDQR